MNLKKAAYICYAAITCAALALPALAAPFSKPADDSAQSGSLSLKTDSGRFNLNLGADAEARFTEHLGLGDRLRAGYDTLCVDLFKTSPVPEVIVGHNGWLYSADTVSDATGVRTLSDDEIRHIVHVLELMRNGCTAKGARMVFAVAPDKSTVYPQYLPKRCVRTGRENDLDALMQAFTHANITTADLRRTLLAAAEEAQTPLYYKQDTHWNADGAVAAFSAMLRPTGQNDQGIAQSRLTVSGTHAGDLLAKLLLNRQETEEMPFYGIPSNHTETENSFGEGVLTTVQPHTTRKLLLFGDSFAEPLVPMFAECFSEGTFVLSQPYPMTLLGQTGADTLILEIAENHLADLLTCAPQMEAPTADRYGTLHEVSGLSPVTVQTRTVGDLVHIYGEYDARYADSSAVLITVRGGGQEETYEAFPCFETALLGRDTHAANGYSIYLPAKAVPEGAELEFAVLRDRDCYVIGNAEFGMRNAE